VVADLKKIKAGETLAPVLLVQGIPLWVAHGYHRICTRYHLREKTPAPCRIVARDPEELTLGIRRLTPRAETATVGFR
jgi:hypothetical protein